MLHAQRHWPEYITTMFGPFNLVAAVGRWKNLLVDMNGHTLEMKFSKSSGSSTQLNHFHTCGYPINILETRLQSAGGAGPLKWGSLSLSWDISWTFTIA